MPSINAPGMHGLSLMGGDSPLSLRLSLSASLCWFCVALLLCVLLSAVWVLSVPSFCVCVPLCDSVRYAFSAFLFLPYCFFHIYV